MYKTRFFLKIPKTLGICIFFVFFLSSQTITHNTYTLNKELYLKNLTNDVLLTKIKIEECFKEGGTATNTLNILFQDKYEYNNFSEVADKLLQTYKSLDALGIIKDETFSQIYPLKAHRYDNLNDILSNDNTYRPLETKGIYYSGPYELEQGDKVFVGRQSVYDNTEKHIGYTMVLISLPVLIEKAGLLSKENSIYTYQLFGINTRTGIRESLLPHSEVFADAVNAQIDYSGLSITMQMKKPRIYLHLLPLILIELLLSLLVGILVYMITRSSYELRKQADEEIKLQKTSDDIFKSLFQNASDGIVILDNNGYIIDANDSICKLLQYKHDEIVNKKAEELIESDNLKAVGFEILSMSGLQCNQIRLITSNGSIIETELSMKTIGSDRIMIIVRDVTELRKDYQQLVLNESILKSAFESSAIGMSIIGIDKKFIRVNKKLCEITGYTDEELLAKTLVDITHPEDVVSEQIHINKLMNGNAEYVQWKKRYTHKDSRLIWARIHLSLVKDENNTPLFFITQMEDITDKLATEEKLLEREKLLELYIEHCPTSLAMFDTEMRYIIYSRRWLEDYNLKDTDIKGKSHYEVFPGLTQEWKNIHHRCLTGDTVTREEDSFTREDGTIEWVKWKIHPWHKASGDIGGIIMFTEVITNRKENELKFQNLVEHSMVGVYIFQDEKIVYANPRYCEIFGYPEKEVINKIRIEDVIYIDDLAISAKKVEERFNNASPYSHYEIRGIRKDGQIIWIEIFGSKTIFNGKDAIIGSVIDITERKKAENELIRINHDINERIKELNCLYRLTEITDRTDSDLVEVVNTAIKIIPTAYQFPEITCVRISVGEYQTETISFLETEWKQEVDILSNEKIIGKIEVFYTEEKPEKYEGPFEKEERLLINTVAYILNNFIEHNRAKEEILRLNRLYQFISHTNEIMLRAETPLSIFSEACRIAVNYGNCRMAWIGTYDSEHDTLMPLCWYGHNEGYLDALISTKRNIAVGNDPIGRAIRNRMHFLCNDMANEPIMEPWRTEAIKRDYLSSISLPILIDSKVEAVFTLYFQEPNFFNETEIKILREMTDNIAFCLEKIEIKERQRKSERELTESENKFRTLVEQSQVGVYILQQEKFVYANPRFEKISGYSREILLNEVTFKDLIHEDDLHKATINYKLRITGELPSDSYIIKAIRSDGEIRYIEIMAAVIDYDGAPAIIGSAIDITERKEEERKIAEVIVEAQEKERLQIGMELHDNVQQILAATLLNLNILKSSYHNYDMTMDIMDNLKNFTIEGISELRRLSHQLAPSIDSSTTMEDKIKTLVSDMNLGEKNIKYCINVGNGIDVLSNDIQISFYRIIQEQINNILKHAEANNVEITIRKNKSSVFLKISDDGKGYDTKIKKDGIGMENIRRRAQLLDGKLEIRSFPQNGCTVIVIIPFRNS